MGGKGGAGNPYGAGNYEMGFSSYTPGGTPGWDPSHPEAGYAQAGWDAAAGQFEQQSLMDTMMEDFMSAFAPQEAPDDGAHYGYDYNVVYANKDSTYDELRAASNSGVHVPDEGYGIGFVWDSNFELDNGSVGGWKLVTEDQVSDLAADRTGTMENYGGFVTNDTNYFEDWGAAIAGEKERDALYTTRNSAATRATDLALDAIGSESSNAALLGLDYGITDEAKQQRINDQFANLWTDEQQSTLTGLMDEWGTPEGFEGFSVTRGAASTGQDVEDPTASATLPGAGGGSYLDEEEEGLGGSTNLLGA